MEDFQPHVLYFWKKIFVQEENFADMLKFRGGTPPSRFATTPLMLAVEVIKFSVILLCFFFSFRALFCVACCGGCTNVQRRAASLSSVDVYVSFERTIETLRDKLQQSYFDLCTVSLTVIDDP